MDKKIIGTKMKIRYIKGPFLKKYI